MIIYRRTKKYYFYFRQGIKVMAIGNPIRNSNRKNIPYYTEICDSIS